MLFAVLAATFVAKGALTQTYAWRNVAVNVDGFVSGLVYYPTQPTVFYATTDGGDAIRRRESSRAGLPFLDPLVIYDSQLAGVISLARAAPHAAVVRVANQGN